MSERHPGLLDPDDIEPRWTPLAVAGQHANHDKDPTYVVVTLNLRPEMDGEWRDLFDARPNVKAWSVYVTPKQYGVDVGWRIRSEHLERSVTEVKADIAAVNDVFEMTVMPERLEAFANHKELQANERARQAALNERLKNL